MELADKVKEYVHEGGTFIVTAENAARIWPEWKIDKSRTVPAGGIVRIGENELVERGNFELYRASLPDEAHVLATVGGEPVVVDICGRANFTFAYSLWSECCSFGIQQATYMDARRFQHFSRQAIWFTESLPVDSGCSI